MTLEEKQAELQEAVENCETSFEQVRLRLRRAELEVEAAHRAYREVEDSLGTAKSRLAHFQVYRGVGDKA